MAVVLGRASLSAVNLAETYREMAAAGQSHETVAAQITRLRIPVMPFDAEQASLVATLANPTATAERSFGDLACLALARHLGIPVFTAARDWETGNFPVPIVVTR